MPEYGENWLSDTWEIENESESYSDYSISDYSPYLIRKRGRLPDAGEMAPECKCSLNLNSADELQQNSQIFRPEQPEPEIIQPEIIKQEIPQKLPEAFDENGYPLCNPNFKSWKDSRGFTCQSYSTRRYCNLLSGTHMTRSWRRRERFRKFDKFQSGGFTALNCPQCGCREPREEIYDYYYGNLPKIE